MGIIMNYRLTVTIFLLVLLGLTSSLVNAETSFESNNTIKEAKVIYVNEFAQSHKFEYAGDEDWLFFYAIKGNPYNIEIENDSVGRGANPVLAVYNEQGDIEIADFDFGFSGEGELLDFRPPSDGFYFIRITNKNREFSVDSHYKIKVFLAFAPNDGQIRGFVFDQCTKLPIEKALVQVGINQLFTYTTGVFGLAPAPGDYTVAVGKAGYISESQSAQVAELDRIDLEFNLQPEVGCTPITPEPIDLEALKQQAVGEFDPDTGILSLKDVRVGADIYSVTLQKDNDFNFQLTGSTLLAGGVHNSPAFFDFETLLVDIPEVFAFDQIFKVQLKKITDDWLFSLKTVDPL